MCSDSSPTFLLLSHPYQPPSLQIFTPSSCLSVWVCDPRSLTRAVCVTVSLDLSFGAQWSYFRHTIECLVQNLSVASD